MNVSGIALNGLNQALGNFESTAKRISLAGSQSDSADLSTDAVSLIQSTEDFATNIKLLKVADELEKSAIDLLA